MNAHREFGIPSTAAIGRHPVHPMLVPLPIGFLVTAFLIDLTFSVGGGPPLATVSAWLIGAGLASGVVAAVAGLVDFIGAPRIRALYHAWYHLIGNVAALTLAFVNLLLRIGAGFETAVRPWGLLFSAATVGLLVFTGWHGGEMVFGHGVGMKRHEHRHGEHGAL